MMQGARPHCCIMSVPLAATHDGCGVPARRPIWVTQRSQAGFGCVPVVAPERPPPGCGRAWGYHKSLPCPLSRPPPPLPSLSHTKAPPNPAHRFARHTRACTVPCPPSSGGTLCLVWQSSPTRPAPSGLTRQDTRQARAFLYLLLNPDPPTFPSTTF